MNRRDKLKAIYESYNLSKDEDIFALHGTAIITKTGIQKICTKEGFKYSYEVIKAEPDYCAVNCTVYDKDGQELANSFGSAESANVKNKQKYFLEMAEKRAKVRAVLIAIDAHGYVYSEEESDEFKRV